MKEIWKDIPDYEGLYQVSNLGRVKSFQRNREMILKPRDNKLGYLKVILSKNKINKNIFVHRIVLLVIKPEIYFNKADVNHMDGNKYNNKLTNLEWCTRKENVIHSFKLGLSVSKKGEQKYNSKLTEKQVLQIRKDYKNNIFNQKQLANIFNVKSCTICKIINRQLWCHI